MYVRLRLLLPAAALALTTSCSHSPGLTSFHGHGVTARYPRTWFATRQPLTPVTSPVQVLAVASYRFPPNKQGASGCAPKAALDRLPPTGAFVFAWEFTMPSPSGLRPADFPRRPSHFQLTRLTETECLGRSYMVRFREAGRFFQVHAVLGPDVSGGTRKSVVHLLDSLRATT